MATLPTDASLTGATTTNAQQKANFSAMRTYLADLLGTDSGNKVAARAALGVPAAADFSTSFAANGLQRLATGFLIQWGSAAPGGAGTTPITFPIPFPNACFIVLCGVNYGGSGAAGNATASSGSITRFGFNMGSTSAFNAQWIALGW